MKGYGVHDKIFTDDVSGSRVDRPWHVCNARLHPAS
jgi:hypothetical protein